MTLLALINMGVHISGQDKSLARSCDSTFMKVQKITFREQSVQNKHFPLQSNSSIFGTFFGLSFSLFVDTSYLKMEQGICFWWNGIKIKCNQFFRCLFVLCGLCFSVTTKEGVSIAVLEKCTITFVCLVGHSNNTRHSRRAGGGK